MDQELQRARRDGNLDRLTALERRAGKQQEPEYKPVFWKRLYDDRLKLKIVKIIQEHAPHLRWWYEFEVWKYHDIELGVTHWKVTWFGPLENRQGFNFSESDEQNKWLRY